MKHSDSIRPDIQGMRALAVIAVIIYHFAPRLLPNGYLGVDIFFVISGFVITGSLARIREDRLFGFFLRFFERRVRRLLPALITCVAVTAVAGMPFIAPESAYYTASWRTGIASLFGLSSVYLYRQSLDYFGASSAFNLFTQTWSLGVEEQFYLFFPLIAWFSGMGRDDGTGRRFLKVLAIGVVLSLGLFVVLGRTNPAASFFLVTSRFWELGAGAVTFLSLRVLSRRSYLTASIVRTGALFAVAAILLLPQLHHIEATILIVLLTVLLLVSEGGGSLAGRVLEWKPAVFVGTISYSLYLWHWSVLVISRWTVGILPWTAPFQIALILLLANASFCWVEQPLRRRSWLSSRVRNVVAGFFGALACAAFLALVGLKLKGTIFLGDSGRNRSNLIKVLSSVDGVSRSAAFPGFYRAVDRLVGECNMTPHLIGAGAKPDVNRAFVQRCIAGDRPKIVLTGDSFAVSIASHVAFAAHELGRDFRLLVGFGWPYPLDLAKVGFNRQSSCEFDLNLIRSEILRQLNQGDILVLRLFFGKPEYITFNAAALERHDSGLLAAYDAELLLLEREVSQRGAHLLVVGANPVVEYSPVCERLQWFNRLQQRSCDRLELHASLLSRFALQHDEHLIRLLSRPGRDETRVIAPSPLFCHRADESCGLVRDGEYLWADAVHINAAAVDLFYPQLLQALRQ